MQDLFVCFGGRGKVQFPNMPVQFWLLKTKGGKEAGGKDGRGKWGKRWGEEKIDLIKNE